MYALYLKGSHPTTWYKLADICDNMRLTDLPEQSLLYVSLIYSPENTLQYYRIKICEENGNYRLEFFKF